MMVFGFKLIQNLAVALHDSADKLAKIGSFQDRWFQPVSSATAPCFGVWMNSFGLTMYSEYPCFAKLSSCCEMGSVRIHSHSRCRVSSITKNNLRSTIFCRILTGSRIGKIWDLGYPGSRKSGTREFWDPRDLGSRRPGIWRSGRSI